MINKYISDDNNKTNFSSTQNPVQAVFDSLLNGIQVLQSVRNEKSAIVNFRILKINKEDFKEFSGKNNFEEKLYLDAYPGSIKAGLFNKLIDVVKDNHPMNDIFHIESNGHSKWLDIKAQKFEDGVILCREDITQRIKAEELAEEQKYFAEQIASMTPDIIQVIDIEKQEVIYANRIIYEDLGYTSFEIKELTLKRTIHLHHPDDRNRLLAFRESFKTASDNEVKEYEGRIMSKDGSWIWYKTRGRIFKRNEEGNVSQYIMVSQNIAKHKKTEQQLQQNNKFLEDITFTLPAIITVFSIADNKIIYASENQLDALGYTSQQIYELNTTQRLVLFVHPDDQVGSETFVRERNKLQDGEILEFEQRLRMGNGEWEWYKTRSKVFTRDDTGAAAHIISTIHNINKQRKSDENIRHLNQVLVVKNREFESCNSELNIFTNVAASQYKQTFRHLYNILETTIIRDGHYLSNASKANLRRMQAALQKLKLLTEDILSYSAIHSESEEIKVDLNSTIEDLENELKTQIVETGTTINYDKLPSVIGQPVLITLLFRHLLINAIKFRSPERNPIIRIESDVEDGINVHGNTFMENIKYTVISIIDNGIGFDTHYANEIFSMFFRLNDKGKYKGSGIGLPVCKKIMQIHQGFITTESIPAQGATFKCFFPVEKINPFQ